MGTNFGFPMEIVPEVLEMTKFLKQRRLDLMPILFTIGGMSIVLSLTCAFYIQYIYNNRIVKS